MNDRTRHGLGPDTNRTPSPRPPAPSSPSLPPAERTSTLRGMGFTSFTLRGMGAPKAPEPAPATPCPCCRVKIDAVSADLSACMGLAIVAVEGVEGAKDKLCEMHKRLYRLLVDELKNGPKCAGDSSAWGD